MRAKKQLNLIGLSYSAFAVVVLGLQIVLSTVASLMLSDKLAIGDNRILLSLLIVAITMDVIGVPGLFLLTKKLPKEPPVKKKLGVGKYLGGVCFCYFIMIIGALIGMLVQFLLTGSSESPISSIMSNGQLLPRVLVVGIGAPVFEELAFRKCLIDHLGKYGKVPAVVASGLMFGLFHGNFSQFFFAAFLGFFWGYIYIQTGNILYTISYHMIINSVNSILSNYLDNSTVVAIYGCAIVLLVLAGLVIGVTFFVIDMSKRSRRLAAEALRRKQIEASGNIEELEVHCDTEDCSRLKVSNLFTSPGMWIFYLLMIVLFVYGYVA